MGAIEIDGAYWPLDSLRRRGLRVPSLHVKELLLDWGANFAALQDLARQILTDAGLKELRFPQGLRHLELAIQYPNKVIAVGANYLSHLVEMGLPTGKWPLMPFFFVPPTTSMTGSGKFVLLPRDTKKLDWEIELAVVVGSRLSCVGREEALSAIAGYSVAIDLSARDLARPAQSPTLVDLARAKGQDTMKPFGPHITPAAFISDPHNLRMRLAVNGQVRQDGRTSDMMYRIDEQLSIISQFVTLEPGDVVLTGTPAGSATVRGDFLQAGDRIVAEIEGIGQLEVEVTDDRDPLWGAGRHFPVGS